MINLDIKDKIYNELKIPEMIALALSKKLNKPYEETIKLTEALIDKKIEEASKNILNASQQKDININDATSIEDFIEGKNVIKG
jgi:hypothetical protein